ncbi:AAA family ATPase [Gemmata sp. G18]|uniref:AAA family ATPase n=1 Tax=Gemmata palustris TaxID=2822762 RepID=A0ABS5BMY3_9BACT|nr:DEAD/DEAH box helicase [Gemmata palustris]MBP3955043.1 AAA family ATPase [Gemmata palustris]
MGDNSKIRRFRGIWDSHLEQISDKRDDRGRSGFTKDAPTRAVRGRDLVEFKTAPWKGNNYADDTAAERELIQRFFHNLVGLIADEAGQDAVPVHFYVWSQGEIRQLIEGCCRAGSNLLGSLQQLFGCREGLEQLIYSCVRDEIDRRFALGWTGRGLGVVASLRWYGRRYHWRRKVNGVACDLDHEFTQNVFDFKTQLDCDAAGGWAKPGTGTKYQFEIRSRFSDSLPAAYWHAVWRTLPDPATVEDSRLKNSIERYNRAKVPNMLKTYLAARCHALRWLEENVNPKNAEIVKPVVTIADLPDFHLDRDDVAKAALDFLRLDQHVKKSNWIAEHLLPPIVRVPLGRTLPLRKVGVGADKKTITGRIELHGFNGLKLTDLETRCSFAAGSFVRLSPWNSDPQRGQTVAQLTSGVGRTCIVQSIDWSTGAVTLESMYAEADAYTVASGGSKQAEVLFTDSYATLDESVTDFVARRVDGRLQDVYAVYDWFDPIDPAPPALPAPPVAETDRVRGLLESFRLPPADQPPEKDQVQAVLDGLSTRVQLLQGPPGTGKTTTTALSVLVRILCGRGPGDIVLLSAHTHRALDELMARIDRYTVAFTGHAASSGFAMPPLRLVKVHSGEPTMNRVAGTVEKLAVSVLKTKKKLTELTAGGVLVLGGTTAGLLKLASEVDKLTTYNNRNGLKGSLLVVDEASMMVFPHFLALATLITDDGRVMLTGDHRQLAPITAHDWDNEDRPPTVLYQPFASAYDAVRRIIDSAGPVGGPLVPPAAARRSALRQTFRLPPVVRELIARIYRQDQIELTGPDREAVAGATSGSSLWHDIWKWNIGVFLVVHDEDGSKRSNETELEVVNQILQAAPPLGLRSVAVITPHRAQRSLFTSRLTVPHGDDHVVDTIDTVERLQGGERPTVVVSATVSDPTAIESNVEFILDLNRANVAFSRVQQRLIVVCAQTLLDHIPAEVEHYQAAMLWKALRELCSVEIGRVNIGGHTVRLLMPPPTVVTGSFR